MQQELQEAMMEHANLMRNEDSLKEGPGEDPRAQGQVAERQGGGGRGSSTPAGTRRRTYGT